MLPLKDTREQKQRWLEGSNPLGSMGVTEGDVSTKQGQGERSRKEQRTLTTCLYSALPATASCSRLSSVEGLAEQRPEECSQQLWRPQSDLLPKDLFFQVPCSSASGLLLVPLQLKCKGPHYLHPPLPGTFPQLLEPGPLYLSMPLAWEKVDCRGN